MTEFYRKKGMYSRGSEGVQRDPRAIHSSVQGKDLTQKHKDLTLKMRKPTSGEADRSKKLLANEPRKASSKPVKMLIAKETSNEAECRHHSPSIVAKLMGLDALPGPETTSKHKRKAVETSYQKIEFERQKNQSESFLHAYQQYPRNSLLSERYPSQRYVMENREFKDVFEIQEMPRFHNLGYPRYQGSNLRSRLSETDMAFVRQKFMDAKRLSTDEKLRNSKEFHDVLDDLHSNKDLFLRVLQEPDSLLTKRPYNVQSVASHSPSSHIAVLKSSKTRVEVKLSENYGNGNIRWKRMSEGRIDMQGMSDNFPSNHDVAHFSSRRTSGYLSDRPGQSRQPTRSNHLTPTRIVVLKPRSVPQSGLSPSQDNFINHTVQRVQQTASQETCEEVMNWQKLSRNNSRMNKRSIGLSSKDSREVTRKLRRCVARSSFSMPSMPSFISEEQPYDLLTADLARGSEVSSSPSGMIYHQNNKLNSWPSYPTDTPRSKEAKKQLPGRWRLSTSSGKLGHLGRSSSTLGEMLGMRELKTENEKSSPTLGYMIGKDGSCNNSAGEEELIGCLSKAARSSRDFKQAGYTADMTRLRARSVSAEGCEFPKAVHRFGSVDGIVNDLISREVIMPGPQWPFSRRHSYLKEETFMRERHSDDYRSHSCRLVKPDNDCLNSSNDCSVMRHCWSLDGQRSSEREMVWYDKGPVNLSDFPGENRLQQILPVTECHSDIAAQHHDDIPSQELGPSLQAMNLKKDPSGGDLLNSDQKIAEVLSTGNCLATSPARGLPKTRVHDVKNDSLHKESQEQPSPVSILEPPFEEESSSSECFEKISADLDGLRKQMRLLRMESSQKCAEDLEFESSAEGDYAAGCHDDLDQVEQGECLKDERAKFMFLRDVLTGSGICGDQNSLIAWHSPDSPLNPCLFEQLNQKYSKRENWNPGNTKDMWVQRSQRRLLFDHINAGLKEILQPTLGSHSWIQIPARNGMIQQWGVQQLAEKLWEIIQNDETESRGLTEIMLTKNLVRDVDWLELRDDVGLVGADIEQALVGDLIVEMVNDLYNVTSKMVYTE